MEKSAVDDSTVEDSFRKVLKDISPYLICSNDEVDILSNIVAALKAVKLVAEALCRQNTLYIMHKEGCNIETF